mgnify:CR=1 FL=1
MNEISRYKLVNAIITIGEVLIFLSLTLGVIGCLIYTWMTSDIWEFWTVSTFVVISYGTILVLIGNLMD